MLGSHPARIFLKFFDRSDYFGLWKSWLNPRYHSLQYTRACPLPVSNLLRPFSPNGTITFKFYPNKLVPSIPKISLIPFLPTFGKINFSQNFSKTCVLAPYMYRWATSPHVFMKLNHIFQILSRFSCSIHPQDQFDTLFIIFSEKKKKKIASWTFLANMATLSDYSTAQPTHAYLGWTHACLQFHQIW